MISYPTDAAVRARHGTGTDGRWQDPAAQTGLPPLYSVAQLRAVEAAAGAALYPHALMERAAQAAVSLALQLLAARTGSLPDIPRVLVAAGPGNNGGDAIECAALLATQGCAVTVWMPEAQQQGGSNDTASSMPADRALALDRLMAVVEAGTVPHPAVLLHGMEHAAGLKTQDWHLVIDGLFGIGLRRPLAAHWRTAVGVLNALNAFNAHEAPLLALDVPSGLDADTGCILREPGSPEDDDACIRATHTLTFIGDMPGLHTGNGRDRAGIVAVAGLDIDAALFPPPPARRNGPDAFATVFRPRRQDSHKGSHGDVWVVGGAAGMAGAAILAAQAALKSGCGRVTIGFLQADPPAFIPGQPELMCRAAGTLADMPAQATCVLGPGLGRTAAAEALVAHACGHAALLMLDADALNLVAASPTLQAGLAARERPAILTPHPLEAARLLETSTAAIQADRLRCARMLAQRYRAIVVLKGSGTIITDGVRLLVNPTGNPALASGGTGDVLAGMCGALLAQGQDVFAAAAGAVWLHGAAADRLVEDGIGPIGVTAGEIIDAARTVRNRMTAAGVFARLSRPAPGDLP